MGLRSNGRSPIRPGLPRNGANVSGKRPRSSNRSGHCRNCRVPFERRRCARAHRIAQDVRDRIAERLWTGGSLIISDEPLSGETGAIGTDLTVKVR
jgi:hypothetical protein